MSIFGANALATALLLAGAFHIAGADTFQQQVNISLVYPRNETYDATAGLIPLVFAVTNAHYAEPLHPFIHLEIYNYANKSSTALEVGSVELTDPSFTSASLGVTYSGDLVYLWYDMIHIAGLEGLWSVEYEARFTYGVLASSSNTSATNNSSPALKLQVGSIFEFGSFVFSTKKGAGATKPDLVATTANTSCAAIPYSRQITVTDILNTPCYDDLFVPKTCPVIVNDTKPVEANYATTPQVVNITTTGYGCGPTMDAGAASAISASITAGRCVVQQTSGITCPPATTGPSRNDALGMSVPGIAVVVAAVLSVATGVLLV